VLGLTGQAHTVGELDFGGRLTGLLERRREGPENAGFALPMRGEMTYLERGAAWRLGGLCFNGGMLFPLSLPPLGALLGDVHGGLGGGAVPTLRSTTTGGASSGSRGDPRPP